MSGKNGVLLSIAELFDLPEDVIAGLPHLEMAGNRQLFLENHRGVLSFSEESIDVNTAIGILRVRGTKLSLLAMTAEALRIGGNLTDVEWVK